MLSFGDVALQGEGETSASLSFTLHNHRDLPARFEWPEHESVTMKPRVGHILPHADKAVTCTFKASEPIKLDEALALTVQLFRPALPEGAAEGTMRPAPVDWDDAIATVTYGDDDEGEGDGSAAAAGAEAAPEPAWDAEGEAREVPLQVKATVDFVRYECETRSVLFRPTMMYQTRVFTFNVTNPCTTNLAYSWAVQDTTRYSARARPGSAAAGRNSNAPQFTPNPFTIEPEEGIVRPGASQAFTVRFAPVEVEDYSATCRASIPSLAPDAGGALTVRLSGRAQRPVCHFELPPCDYLERRPVDLPMPSGAFGAFDPATRVLEFKSLGTRVRNTRRFFVVNPTNVAYSFAWEVVGGASSPAFRCASPRGMVLAGKRFEMVFEYTPSEVKTTELLYRFMVPEHNIDQLFLVVGSVVEPRVFMDRNHVNFRELLIGGSATEKVNLVNEEVIPFQFSFDTSSFQVRRGTRPPLRLVPQSGVVPPGGKLPVEVVFAPGEEKAYNFNVGCVVKKKPTRLSLNVKGEGYAVHDRLTLQDDTTGTGVDAAAELTAEGINYVEFGHVHVNERAVKEVIITNTGKVNFDFNWRMAKRNPMVTIKPEVGKVPKGGRVACKLEFHPVDDVNVDSLPLVCTVAGDRVYQLSVSGVGARPALSFSFVEHDFGPCFVPSTPGAPAHPETAILRVANNDLDEDISFDCLFEKKPHLEVQCAATVLRPGEAVEVPVVFAPRDVRRYTDVIPFEVNGLYTVSVAITGEGTPLKVELVNPAQMQLNFGTLRVGQESTRTVHLVNRSKRVASFRLEEVLEAGEGRLDERCVSYYPARETILRPHEQTAIDVRFSPVARIPAFSEELLISLGGEKKRLLTVSGACQGMDVKLETDSVTYGQVCEGSQLTKHVAMFNTGDIGTKFSWDEASMKPDFSVHPVEGFLAPHSDTKIAITFQPTRINDDVRYEGVTCDVEGAEPLTLTLTGECVPQPESDIQEVSFEARVREEASQTITLPTNNTGKSWRLQAVISNDYWHGAATVEVPAGKNASYTLTYKPLTMTVIPERVLAELQEGKGDDGDGEAPEAPPQHEGSVFFALPDGRALLYRLKGKATEPSPGGTVTKETPAKQSLAVPLRVENWLGVTQRFRVRIDLENPEPSTFLRGPETLDVPAAGHRDYKLTFYAYKECSTAATVSFTNTVTGEYIDYRVELKATPPGVVGVIPLQAPVRATVKHIITVDNPLGSDTKLQFQEASCSEPTVRVRALGSNSTMAEAAFEVTYRPLLVQEEAKEVPLTLSCDELGEYHYTLQLKATPTGVDPALRFKAALGAEQVQVYRFHSYVAAATTYKCETQHPECFEVAPTVQAPAGMKCYGLLVVVSTPNKTCFYVFVFFFCFFGTADTWEGVEVEVRVRFEPNATGELRDMLRVTSDAGGEYACPLVGIGNKPRPQGPLTISNGGQTTVEFKNVFNEA